MLLRQLKQRAVSVARSLPYRPVREPLADYCFITVKVLSKRTARVQEGHITIGHLWCEMVDELLGKQS